MPEIKEVIVEKSKKVNEDSKNDVLALSMRWNGLRSYLQTPTKELNCQYGSSKSRVGG